jgi:hypothetical protein
MGPAPFPTATMPQPAPVGQPMVGGMGGPAPKRSNMKLIMIIVGIVVVLAGAGAAAFFLMQNNNTGSSNNSSQSSNTVTLTDIVATSLSDFSNVCDNSKITNAAAYDSSAAGPHPIGLFDKNDYGSYNLSSVYLGTGLDAQYDKPEATQLVGCLSRTGNGTQVKTCDLQDSKKQTVSLKLMSSSYNIDIYEAKTGKKLDHVTIDKTKDTCPYVATYDPNDPTYYAQPEGLNTFSSSCR